jgi:hypothetical protein
MYIFIIKNNIRGNMKIFFTGETGWSQRKDVQQYFREESRKYENIKKKK